ncbi:MAG: hypothetical protein KY455_09080 [Euryarchaeota archaeon]|nr:hypothetical protein [Euryarchaeota archaeon]
MPLLRASCVFLVNLAILLATCGTGTSASSSAAIEGVWTTWPVEVDGTTSLRGATGGVLIKDPPALESTRLTAEKIVIKVGWERGVYVQGDRSLWKHVVDRGRDSISLNEATVGFSSFQGVPLFLGFSDTDEIAITATARDGLTLIPSDGDQVVTVGTTSETVSAGDDPAMLGFSYITQGPAMKGITTGSARVEGSFDLFVHDVRIEAEGQDGAWSDWTGYWESDPGAPFSEYELRVTVLHVKNGTFSSTGENIGLFLPSMDIDVDGTITSTDVTGRIRQDDDIHIFKSDRFRLEGSGSLAVEAAPVESIPSVWVRSAEGFKISGASTVETLPAADAADPGPAFRGLASFGALGLIAAVGLMTVGIIPAPTAGSRSYQYGAWMRQGDRAAECREWRRASRCYRRAARSQRSDPSALFEWARAELEAGDPVAAERAASRAAALPDMDRADALELLVWTAHLREDDAAVERRLTELTDVSPEIAHQVARDIGITAPRLVDGPSDPTHGEVLDGYA